MGLDMYLYKANRVGKLSAYELLEMEMKHTTSLKQIAYWRKADNIHMWFVNNVQDGIDDRGTYEVTKEMLEDLLHTCKSKWCYKDIEDTISIIEDILQTTDFEREMIMYHACW